MAKTWQNRIVGYGEETPDQLIANPRNWRIHPTFQQAALKGSLTQLGWIQDVIVNKRTGFVLDGHARVTLAMRHDQPVVPVKYVDLSDDEEALALATLDPLASLAVADPDQLIPLLRQAQAEDAALQQMLNDLALNVPTSAVPSLDELADRYGDHDEVRLWPVLRLQLDPETMERYESLLDLAPGVTDAERFRAILNACDPAALADDLAA